jgi:hypothetical protein
MMICAAKSTDPKHYAAAVATAIHRTSMHSRRRTLEEDLDRLFNMKFKLNLESTILVDGYIVKMDVLR